MTKLAAAEVAALDPYKFMATIGKRVTAVDIAASWPESCPWRAGAGHGAHRGGHPDYVSARAAGPGAVLPAVCRWSSAPGGPLPEI